MSQLLPSFPLATSTPYDQVWQLVGPALEQTAVMVGAVSLLTILLGLPLGAFLHNVGARGLATNLPTYHVVGWGVNLLRSLPFLILMAAIIPFTRLIVGTTIGTWAAVVPLTIASVPFYARLAEASLRDVPPEVIDVSLACGGSRLQTVRRVQIAEALPGLVSGFTVTVVGIIALTTLAGALGAGGLGNLALSYGYQLFDTHIMIATVVVLVVVVQLVQLAGDALHRYVSRG